MAYATVDQVQIAVGGSAKLIELSDLENGAVLDVDVVNAAIAKADGVINSYIGHRYSVPLATVPDTISEMSADMAARVLRRRKFNGQELIDDIDAEKVDRKWLEGVANGTISLGIEPTPPKASIVNDEAGERESTKEVSRQRLRGMW